MKLVTYDTRNGSQPGVLVGDRILDVAELLGEQGGLLMTNGCLKAFARTKAERETTGDPRLSIEARYSTHKAYVDRVEGAVDELVKEGFLLPEDGKAYVEAAKKRTRWTLRW